MACHMDLQANGFIVNIPVLTASQFDILVVYVNGMRLCL
jgi:hypothetical protein